MKRPHVDGGFLFCFGLNLILSAYWAIPAVVLFVAHVIAGTPLWAAWLALGLWVLITFGITLFLSWAVSRAPAADAQGAYSRRSSSSNRKAAAENAHHYDSVNVELRTVESAENVAVEGTDSAAVEGVASNNNLG